MPVEAENAGDLSPSPSPSPKRQRMSSPTYDDQIDFPSQAELKGVDALEVTMSQRVHGCPDFGEPYSGRLIVNSQGIYNVGEERLFRESLEASGSGFKSASALIKENAVQITESPPDADDPFKSDISKPSGFQSAFSLPSRKRNRSSLSNEPSSTPDSDPAEDNGRPTGTQFASSLIAFTSAAAVATHMAGRSRSPTPDSDDPPPQRNWDAWFGEVPPAVDLTNVAAVHAEPSTSAGPPFLGFAAATGKLYVPSAAALKAAEERWRAADEEENIAIPPRTTPEPQSPQLSPKSAAVTSPPRRALSTVVNSSTQSPGRTASQASASAGFSTPRAVFQIPALVDVKGKAAVKPFKSPLIRGSPAPLSAPAFTSSRLNPNPPPPSQMSFATPAKSFRPLVPGAAMETPVRLAAFSTPPRALGVTPLRKGGAGPKKFVTPFKPGMRPGEPGRSQLEEKIRLERAAVAAAVESVSVQVRISSTPRATKAPPTRPKYFDLSPPENRKTLSESNLWPQMHTAAELVAMGINVDELENINPETAIYYSFNAASSAPSSSQDPHPVLGPTEALEALQALGCTLATQDWVDNHWRLILWKLAGMACFDPLRENLSEPRWSWTEVMRQLRYRYERELNGGARPALRLITTQDAPASSHMVLCVSNIFWSEGGVDQVGLPIIPHPELEVTDGWYRLRAEVDAPLARAVRKGNLRVGRKIAVAGAKLSRDAEACEVLEAYGKVHLVFSGNASQLAPWDAKLGFQPRPAVATLHSLTPDGGMVQQLDLVVTKVYPIGFIEFFEDENGEKSREGPRKEKEEMKLHEAWLKRREKEEERIRRDFEDKFFFFNEWAERLEQKVGENFRPKDTDVPPPQVETYYERLLDKADYKLGTLGISTNVAGWLARHLREEIAKLHETMHTDMERELKDLVPPRDVRNFRVLFMTDAATSRRPANRVVEVTVWDVLSLALDESAAAGAFREGQRFRVTNLVPSQKSAWMDAGPDSHVYLSTGRGSKWMKMRSA